MQVNERKSIVRSFFVQREEGLSSRSSSSLLSRARTRARAWVDTCTPVHKHGLKESCRVSPQLRQQASSGRRRSVRTCTLSRAETKGTFPRGLVKLQQEQRSAAFFKRLFRDVKIQRWTWRPELNRSNKLPLNNDSSHISDWWETKTEQRKLHGSALGNEPPWLVAPLWTSNVHGGPVRTSVCSQGSHVSISTGIPLCVCMCLCVTAVWWTLGVCHKLIPNSEHGVTGVDPRGHWVRRGIRAWTGSCPTAGHTDCSVAPVSSISLLFLSLECVRDLLEICQ